jgi:osmoprotectant transport system permease protein
MKILLKYSVILLIVITAISLVSSQQRTIKVGTKHFNESYILGEILSQLLESKGYNVERKYNLGGTMVGYEALVTKEIDVYPEYTGTISEAILKLNQKISFDSLKSLLKNESSLDISEPLGFNNTYAFAVRNETANKLNLEKISDLRDHPELKFGLSYEFLNRQDGWINLSNIYQLPQKPVGLEHGLAYQALEDGRIDLTDVYSTDGEIPRYDLKILADDMEFFPAYFAVSFYQNDETGEVKEIFNMLSGKINDDEMQEMNEKVVFENRSFAEVAREFLTAKNLIEQGTDNYKSESEISQILTKTGRHLELTGIALFFAILIALPLGILIYLFSAFSKPVLYLAGLMQTIPSIALLAFMIPLFGIGVFPAVVALFLYALLPILRNTSIALFSVDPLLKEVSSGIGLSLWQKLKYVELPLSMPTIIAGIRTAAVITIGTATLAAFIGAGGLGEFIVTGLALHNTRLILMGARPAAFLAIVTEFLFEGWEKLMIPKHLKKRNY